MILGSLDVVKDVSVDFIMPSFFEPGNYSEVWQITNNDHVTGQTDSLTVLVDYFFENVSSNYTRTLNRFTKSGGPLIEFTGEEIKICVNVTALNFLDPNLSNNYVCKTFFGEKIEEESIETNFCNCEFKLNLDNNIIRSGETLRYGFEFCSNTYPLPVSYWIEDMQGHVVRNIVNTTSSSLKSFTPNHDDLEKSYVIKGKVNNCDLEVFKVFGSYNKRPAPHLEVRSPDILKFGDKFNVEITGVKDSNKRVLDIFVERNNVKYSEVTKVYADDFRFGFTVPVFLFNKDESYSGVYNLVVSGLDLYHEEKVFIQGFEKKAEVKPFLEPKFVSFYTRKQLFDGTLNVQYAVENVFSGRLEVITSKGKHNASITTRTGSLEVEISSRNEIVLGLLYDNNGVLFDEAFILLNLTIREEQETNIYVENNTTSSFTIAPYVKENRFRRIFAKIFNF
jgi:hypothetical protein